MSNFLKFEHNSPINISSWSSSIRLELSSEILSILEEDDFPIKLSVKKILNDELLYSSDLFPNYWSMHPAFEGCYVEAKTSKGITLLKEYWDPIKHGCLSDMMFYTWCLKNPGSKGIAIGTNDGTTGEYVIPNIRGLISDIVLVEASDRIFEKLSNNYSRYENIRTINTLVSTKSEKLKFYESTSGQGLVNSVYSDYANFFNEDIIEVEKSAIGINEIILQNQENLDWLHLDVEGLDSELIMAIDFNRVKKPKVIIYENNNNKNQKVPGNVLIDYLNNLGYEVFGRDNELNNIAILKKPIN